MVREWFHAFKFPTHRFKPPTQGSLKIGGFPFRRLALVGARPSPRRAMTCPAWQSQDFPGESCADSLDVSLRSQCLGDATSGGPCLFPTLPPSCPCVTNCACVQASVHALALTQAASPPYPLRPTKTRDKWRTNTVFAMFCTLHGDGATRCARHRQNLLGRFCRLARCRGANKKRLLVMQESGLLWLKSIQGMLAGMLATAGCALHRKYVV